MSGASGSVSRRRTVEFRIEGMDCAACMTGIRQRLGRLDGVLSTDGSPMGRRLAVQYDEAQVGAETIRQEITELGYAALPAARETAERALVWRGRMAVRTYAAAVLLIAGLAAGVLVGWDGEPRGGFLPRPGAAGWLFLLAAALGASGFVPKAVRAALRRVLDMHVLMSVAILGAVALGEYVEAAAIGVLFSLAELLELHAAERARASVRAMMALSPDLACVLRDGREEVISAREVRVGEEVLVRSGERIPVDGLVVTGRSAVDEAAILGESMPNEKGPGSAVFAGTFVHEGFLRVRSTREPTDTTLARMVRLVQEADRRRSPTERFVERFARVYTPAVALAAVGVVALPVLAFGQPVETWLLRGLTLLVIACPCALVISTPVSVVSGITGAARNGVLIKGGWSLETMGRVRVVAFDKTGTLSHGRAELAEVVALDGAPESEVIRLAAVAEVRSEHPVGRAIVRAARERGAEVDHARADEFETLPGRGVRARLDGREVLVGSPALLPPGRVPECVGRLAAAGRTPAVVSVDGTPIGVLGLHDPPRAGARRTIAELRSAGVRRIVVLTGDAPAAAAAMLREIGADEVLAGLGPEEKVQAVRRLEREHGAVAMVGDGVNDAPALAAASVGIAMGAAGSDTALETADVALLGDDLSRLPYLYRLSRRSHSIIRQNVTAAILIKAILAAAVPLGAVSLITAVLAGDLGASLGVTLNAMRLAHRERRG